MYRYCKIKILNNIFLSRRKIINTQTNTGKNILKTTKSKITLETIDHQEINYYEKMCQILKYKN